MQKKGLQKYAFYLIPILFLLYSAPSALDYVFHFPDEKYYTDAVIHMMDKGDYFTPYAVDETPRFKKPIITYWVVMSSYKLFGVSQFSSRLFFWLAGAFLVAITFLMAKSLSGNREIATAAAFITAANPLIYLSASRSIPDILLVLFLTISAWGFLEIMLSENRKKKFYWMAYLGAALAFETKGLPAAAFAIASMLFLVLNPWKKIPFEKLFEPVSLLVSIVVALSWFVIMHFEHGSVYLNSFFADQVGERVSSKSGQIFGNAALGIVNLVAFLIPWIIILFSKPKKLKNYVTGSEKSTKAIFGFILLWVVLVILMAGAVFKFYDRYLLPVIPLISVFIAMVLIQSKTSFKKPVFFVFLILNLISLTINILYAFFIHADTILIIGTIFSILIIGAYFLKAFKTISFEVLIANAFLLLIFSAFILMYPLLMPNPGKQLVENLEKNGATKNENIYVYGNIRAASNIRIHCNNKLSVISMDTVFSLPHELNHYLVFNQKEKDLLNLKNYEIKKGSEEWSRLPIGKFPGFMQNTVLGIKNSGTTYLIATPLK